MKPWEELAAGIGRFYLERRGQLRGQLDELVDAWTDERTVHEQILASFVRDETWAQESARAVAERLNEVRHPRVAIEPIVLWANGLNAFTMPGTYLYITRQLMEVLPMEGQIGFVLAHEMAHHDLGHLSIDPKFTSALAGVPHAGHALLIAKHTLMVGARPEWELAADAEAARLCAACGWPIDDAVTALRALEQWALDHGQLDAVFGSDPDATSAFGEWLRQRRTGYLSLRDRIERLERLPV